MLRWNETNHALWVRTSPAQTSIGTEIKTNATKQAATLHPLRSLQLLRILFRKPLLRRTISLNLPPRQLLAKFTPSANLITTLQEEERDNAKNKTDEPKQTASPRNAKPLEHRSSSKRQHHSEQAARTRSRGDGARREDLVRVDEVVGEGLEDEQVCDSERYACQDWDDPVDRRARRPAEPEHRDAEEWGSETGERDSAVFLFAVPGWLWDFSASSIEVDVPEEDDTAGHRTADADGEEG
jgi:hypothetical protein